jgi:ketosteroid isomerase-like protein
MKGCYPSITEVRRTCLFILLFFSGSPLLTGCNDSTETRPHRNSFQQTLTDHLQAIASKDLNKLEPTVGDSVVMISPDGERMDSKEVFIAFHERWFQQKYWLWEYDLIRTYAADSLGYAVLQYSYTQRDSIGVVQYQNQNFLVLIFKNTREGWQLIHDQNTQTPIQRNQP